MLKRHKMNITYITYMLAIVCFGMFEMVVTSGQFSMTMLWILFYFAGANSKMCSLKRKNGGKESNE